MIASLQQYLPTPQIDSWRRTRTAAASSENKAKLFCGHHSGFRLSVCRLNQGYKTYDYVHSAVDSSLTLRNAQASSLKHMFVCTNYVNNNPRQSYFIKGSSAIDHRLCPLAPELWPKSIANVRCKGSCRGNHLVNILSGETLVQ